MTHSKKKDKKASPGKASYSDSFFNSNQTRKKKTSTTKKKTRPYCKKEENRKST